MNAKHLISSLLCAGLCLCAMAGTPSQNYQIRTAKVDPDKAMLIKDHRRGNPVNARMELRQSGDKAVTPREFFKQHNVTPGDNRMNKRAPRRMSDEDVAANTYLDFRYVYQFIDDGSALDWHDYHFRGNQGCYWQLYQGQLYCAGLYWSEYTNDTHYLPVTIDYQTNEVWLPSGILLDDDTIEGTYTTSTRLKVDTVNYSFIVDSDWYLGISDDFNDIGGWLYGDGSIEFNDTLGYVFAGYQVVNKYSRTGNTWTGYNYTLQNSDTTYFEEFYFNTQFIVPNATHDYDIVTEANIIPRDEYNLLDERVYPIIPPITPIDPIYPPVVDRAPAKNATKYTHYTQNAYMYQYDDTTAVVFNIWGLGMPYVTMNIYPDGTMKFPLDTWPVGELSISERDYYAGYFGSAYLWDYTRWYWPLALDENFEETSDTEIIGTVEPTTITWGPSECYLPGIIRVSDGQEMAMTTYPLINNVLNFTDGSEFIFPIAIVPGDANGDGEVNITDVTVLINHLLSEDFDESDEFKPDNADFDQNAYINLVDLVKLIDYILQAE